VNLPSESPDQNNDKRLKVIFASWITSDSVAATTSSRTVNQFLKSPKKITFVVDAKDTDNKTGDYVNISSRRGQALDGSNELTLSQVLSVEEITHELPGTHYKFTVQEAQFSGRYARIMSSGATSVYSSATETEKDSGAYIVSAGAEIFSDGEGAYKIP